MSSLTGGRFTESRLASPIAVSLDFQLADDAVRLRALNSGDASIVEKASFDPDGSRYLGVSRMHHLSEAHDWIDAQRGRRQRGERLDFAIVPVGGVVVIGAVGLSRINVEHGGARVGVWVTPRARQRGFASAAVRLMSAWALAPPVDLARLELAVDAADHAERNTALSAGYELEAVLRSYRRLRGRRIDTAMYSLIATDLEGSREMPSP